MMKLKSIAIFHLKMNMTKMKEASRQMKATHPVLQQSFQIGNHVTFRSFLEIARYLFSLCCDSWIGIQFQMADSISDFKILNFWPKTMKFITTKKNA